jgi:lipopolysaccharide export system protein LptA
MEETAASGTRQTTQGDRLEAHFVPGSASRSVPSAKLGTNVVPGNSTQIQSATMDGHVVMTQQPVAKPGGQASAMRATSGRAVYEEVGQWLHLTLSPRVEDGGLQLTADKIDVSQASGDAFAHGDVKASWVDAGPANGISKKVGGDKQEKSGKGEAAALGGQGPAHAVSAEAQLHQLTGEATFRGRARLWQGANSVSAPVIVLDRTKQTLVARGNGPAEPVQVVMVSTAGPAPGNGSDKNEARGPAANQALPTVIRVRGGDLKYSDAERKALMRSGALGSVVAETGTATVDSNEVELVLLPPGNHAGKDGEQAQVDRMTARGHVSISSEGRRGTGDQLVYEGENGEYVLTGTGSVPPRLTDPARGTVTGEALIFRSRDDSVSVEAGGRKTMTETTAPK